MAKKKKSKFKKILKTVAPLAALALGATALRRRKQNQTYLDEEGGARSDMRDYGPYSKRNMNAARNFKFNPAMMLSGVGDDPGGATIDGYPIQAGAKKGGRIVKTKGGGKAVRGLGRAFTKGRK